jgi:protein phosphatase
VEEPADLQLAPFVVLAAEGALLAERDHSWHMSIAQRLAAADGFIRPTRNLTVDLDDPESESAAVTWWEQLVSAGGEGMVVKPLDSIVTGTRGLIQPGIKCRGPEYLRIIYGPEYRMPHNLERLRDRKLGRKRSLAQREFALGIEAIERFVSGEPLHRVHECVFGVLAMESEPVDPRL